MIESLDSQTFISSLSILFQHLDIVSGTLEIRFLYLAIIVAIKQIMLGVLHQPLYKSVIIFLTSPRQYVWSVGLAI